MIRATISVAIAAAIAVAVASVLWAGHHLPAWTRFVLEPGWTSFEDVGLEGRAPSWKGVPADGYVIVSGAFLQVGFDPIQPHPTYGHTVAVLPAKLCPANAQYWPVYALAWDDPATPENESRLDAGAYVYASESGSTTGGCLLRYNAERPTLGATIDGWRLDLD